MSKPAVLCIAAEVLSHIKTATNIKEEYLQFMNRKVVDAKDITVGKMFPQIIPSIAVQAPDGKFLTYARNGNETRLHGSRSLTIGGHIDITDYQFSMLDTIVDGANREVYEETGLKSYLELTDFKDLIYLPVDDVSKVHLGLFTVLAIKDINLIVPDEELHDIRFVSKEKLVKDLSLYEAWSQHIITHLI